MLADGDYGRSYELRTSVRAHGFDYGLGIHSPCVREVVASAA